MNRRLIHYIIASLLALVLLYVASSGPVLRFAYRDKERLVPVGELYAPLFSGAKALHLMIPLGLYLRAWDVVVGIANTDGRMYILSEKSMELLQKPPVLPPPKPQSTSNDL